LALPAGNGARGRRKDRTRCDPLIVGLELQPEFVVENPEIAVSAAHDCLRYDGLHFLRNDADVGAVASIVSKAIEAEIVVKTAEQHSVVFQRGVGSSTTTTTEPAAGKALSPTHARPAALRLHVRCAAALNIAERRVAPRAAHAWGWSGRSVRPQLT
jgi:hypothetical protein